MGIENTSKRSPGVHVLGALSEGSDNYILGMEAAGQRQLVNSTDLPTDTNDRDADFEALGFRFGAPHSDDPMFRPATLPDGWEKRGTDHSMHSKIVDEKGRERVGIFYKAAFYDRSANMYIVHPTNRLSNAFYAEEPPTSIELDDLLTAEMALEWLVAKRVDRRGYLDMPNVQSNPERKATYAGQVARVDLMLSLLLKAE
jgi:hypothetical protein